MNLPWDSKDRVDSHDGGYHREASDPRYHTTRWIKLSRRWRIAHPLCEECKRNGIIKAAECVDHIDPWPICKDYFFDRRNLQALCNSCNHLKGQRDKERIQEWNRTHNED